MKIRILARQFILANLVLYLTSCSGILTNTGIPPYGTTLAFEDQTKAAALKTGGLLVERVDLTDSTLILRSKRMLLGPLILEGYYSSAKYTYLFLISSSDSLVVKGQNKFRLTYPDKKDVDWLEFYTRSPEGYVPEQVRFNGKEIPRLTVDEPVSPSYLYVLK